MAAAVTGYLARGLNLLVLFALLPLLMRVLGEQEVGWYIVLSTAVVLLQSDVGLGSALATRIRQAVYKAEGRVARYAFESAKGTFRALLAVVTVLFVAIVVPLVFSIRPASVGLVDAWAAIVLTYVQLLALVRAAFWRSMSIANDTIALTNIVSMAHAVFRVAVPFALAFANQLSIHTLLLSELLLAVVVAIVLRIANRSGVVGAVPLLALSKDEAGQHVDRQSIYRSNAHVLVFALSSLLLLQGATVFASAFLSLSSVTAYAAAFRVYQAGKEASGVLSAVLLPAASDAAAEGSLHASASLYLRLTCACFAIQVSFAAGFAMFGSQLMVVWLGTGVGTEAFVAAVLLMPSLVVGGLHVIGVPFLISSNRMALPAGLHVLWLLLSFTSMYPLSQLVGGASSVSVAIGWPIILLEFFYLRHVGVTLNLSVACILGTVCRRLVPVSVGLVFIAVVISSCFGRAGVEQAVLGFALMLCCSALVLPGVARR